MSIYDEIRAERETLKAMPPRDLVHHIVDTAKWGLAGDVIKRSVLVHIAALCVSAVEALDKDGG